MSVRVYTTHITASLSSRSLRAQLSAVDERENTLRDQCKQKEAECASMAEELKRWAHYR